MKYLLLICTIITANTLMAQVKPASKSPEDVTLQAVFDKSKAHKEGYDINGRIVNLPDNVAAKCDKKKIQLTGTELYYHIKPEDLKVKEKDGSTSYMQGRTGDYTVFVVKKLELWNDKTSQWEVVYTNNSTK